jgi:uncharacterized protein
MDTAMEKNEAILSRSKLLRSELDRYLALLERHYQPEQVWLFGSFAHDEASEWSDLDLVIVRETEQRFLDRIKEVMSLLKPKVGVDILVYTPDEFNKMSRQRTFVQSEVLHKGQLVYERSK